jgi:hypothetical protein
MVTRKFLLPVFFGHPPRQLNFILRATVYTAPALFFFQKATMFVLTYAQKTNPVFSDHISTLFLYHFIILFLSSFKDKI